MSDESLSVIEGERATAPPAPPVGLRESGSALWASIVAPFELDPREQKVLEVACRQADLVADLEALLEEQGLTVVGSQGQPRLSPVPSELRQARLCLGKLLDQISLPNDAVRVSRRNAARRAAEKSWAVGANR